jgi:flagellar motor switch protein FliG
MENNKPESKGIFINGRKQIIDMLQIMNESEKAKLLRNISARNPAVARELSESSFNFNDLDRLDDYALARLIQNINPAVVGLALQLAPLKFQKRILSIMERGNAERAYQVMTSAISKVDSEKARNKIIETAVMLSRKGALKI